MLERVVAPGVLEADAPSTAVEVDGMSAAGRVVGLPGKVATGEFVGKDD